MRWITNTIYHLCIWALERDFGDDITCDGTAAVPNSNECLFPSGGCAGCQARWIRYFLKDTIEL